MEELLILVDQRDRKKGCVPKLQPHRQGLLHRAFSIFIFDHAGRLLLQQRAFGKYHSQGLWTNTCCGHPRLGERTPAAAKRRLQEEMGMTCSLRKVSTLLYREQVSNQLIEHEFDHIFAGISDCNPVATPAQAHAWQWLTTSQIAERIGAAPEGFTFWFRRILKATGTARVSAWKELAELRRRAVSFS
ncbi:isopentenyl-diphosphate delta-isomerase [Pseudomonas grimontii]|uniref:Isopentenyl-diphosphate Delta-isomerase n=1 Tax=Pseudomonas grimontii TaxID=129847 RepID=A0A1H1IP62_9PSED|nr:isopentenyl-diphosphate Delta-isomerase [Pseudomonas grimontii]TWR70471.1 isopentenyl-diphosphate Delta-isomerase [Pseudomonas grimontii]SDR39410.1 isopentenyl-diphosphate delta-isomerase [Pseudomonas grimontii]